MIYVHSNNSIEGKVCGTHYQRYVLSKVLSMVLHEVGTEQ